ncbi:MAG: tetratricopeptide repeat protein, partial [Chloroflexota bacterium]|nr:tetratricopeptide repeat protein [Chloroflexota bacterium]
HAHAGKHPTSDFRARVLIATANAEIWSGDRGRAATYLEEARSLADDMGDHQRAAFLLSLALSYRDNGDLEAAIRAGQRSLALYESLDARREQVTLENGLALAHLGLGSLDKAEAHAVRASEMAHALAAEELLTHVNDTLAQIALARQDWPRAVALADDALAIARRYENRHAEIDGLLTRARTHAGQNKAGAAIEDFEAGALLARDIGSKRQLRNALSSLGEFLADQGRHADAVAAYRELVAIE